MGGQIGVLWGYGGCGEWGMLDIVICIYILMDRRGALRADV